MLIIEFDNDNAKNENVYNPFDLSIYILEYGISNPIFEASKNYLMRFILLYTFLIDIALKFVTEQIIILERTK